MTTCGQTSRGLADDVLAVARPRGFELSDITLPGHLWQALPTHAEAEVYSSYLQRDHTATFAPGDRWGVYLYLLEGGPILVNGEKLAALDALMATYEKELDITAESDAELLLIHVLLTIDPHKPGEVSDVADPRNQ